MKILLVDDNAVSRQKTAELLIQRGITAFHPVETIQEGIEVLENQADDLSLVICKYRGHSKALLQLLVQLSGKLPCILFIDKNTEFLELSLVPRLAQLIPVERGNRDGFVCLLDQFQKSGMFENKIIPDSEFVKVSTAALKVTSAATMDFFLRLAPGHYTNLIQGKDLCGAAEANRYFQQRGINFLYARKTDFDRLMAFQSEELDLLFKDSEAEPERMLAIAEDKLEIVHNVVNQLGFTPQVQELTKKTVELALKAVGASPQLSVILKKMQMQQGRYIASHSLMLAEIACAVAHRIGWNSATTFLKLSLASFIHDLPLNDNRLARLNKLEEVSAKNGFTPAEAQSVKMHPFHAAELSRLLDQLPADVDTLLTQHHERPDGSGFPRGLHHHQISPLACIFIVAHDLLDFFLEYEGTNPATNKLEAFLFQMESQYDAGIFRKVAKSLATGIPLKI